MKHPRGKRPKKRVFAGRNMHIEFHTVNPKKEKPADCIYLNEKRECQNKQSPEYLSKCFAASYCTYKVKAAKPPKKAIAPPPPPKPEPQIKSIQCSLPLKCHVYSSTFGRGEYTKYYPDKRTIEITFNGTARKFIYPDAFIQKHLIVPEFTFKIVQNDITKAKKG